MRRNDDEDEDVASDGNPAKAQLKANTNYSNNGGNVSKDTGMTTSQACEKPANQCIKQGANSQPPSLASHRALAKLHPPTDNHKAIRK